MKSRNTIILACACMAALLLTAASPNPQDLNPQPPQEPVKLIFIHHSTGENWLADGYGNLGRELGENNYFVSDTNYGWGPDSIGDRTDIPDWLEWFDSEQTAAYMQALFNESDQHADYTRRLADPGGENRIILFKSCFPNSELGGSPDDPPGTYGDLTVSGAKFVYNRILEYFGSRPDKLFVVITAPPVSSREHAANARAFNNWLVNDWLKEAEYTHKNVVVFDFYNVLTDANAHHRYTNGKIEHIAGARDTLAYPSGDDHPSEKGSQKATQEFVPFLNSYYHQWIVDAPAAAETETGNTAALPQPTKQIPRVESQAPTGALIDDFEGSVPPGTNGWEVFRDESVPTTLRCEPDESAAYDGTQSLVIDFAIRPNSWATCNLLHNTPQDWSGYDGLTFYLSAAQAGLIFNVDLYAGSPDAQETYQYTIETPPDSTGGWIPISLYWSDFHRVKWEEDAGAVFDHPEQITGLAFGLNTYPDTPNEGVIRVDDLGLIEAEPVSAGTSQ